jgi:nicotinate-nucleotide adenylyltransferase
MTAVNRPLAASILCQQYDRSPSHARKRLEITTPMPSRRRPKPDVGSEPLCRPAQRWRGQRIGLLGGSFNPAHSGHLHISRQALKRLRLDAVWWLVSPQNPLKSATGMAPLAARLASARALVRDRRIVPGAVESALETRFTVDTVTALQRCHRSTTFIWLIGSDNVAQLHRWRRWKTLLTRVAIAVIDRPGYVGARWSAPVLAPHRKHIVPEPQARRWPQRRRPVIVMLTIPRNGLSATAIRAADPQWAARFESTTRTKKRW